MSSRVRVDIATSCGSERGRRVSCLRVHLSSPRSHLCTGAGERVLLGLEPAVRPTQYLQVAHSPRDSGTAAAAHRKKTNNEPRTRPLARRVAPKPQGVDPLCGALTLSYNALPLLRASPRALSLSQTGSDSRGRGRPFVGLLDEEDEQASDAYRSDDRTPARAGSLHRGRGKTIIDARTRGPLFSRDETGRVSFGGKHLGRFALFPRGFSSFPLRRMRPGPSGSRVSARRSPTRTGFPPRRCIMVGWRECNEGVRGARAGGSRRV